MLETRDRNAIRDYVEHDRFGRLFCHQVTVLIPGSGLVAIADSGAIPRLKAAYEFCRTHSLWPYGPRREPPSDLARFCFADPAHADVFMAEFRGERATIDELGTQPLGPRY